MGGRWLASILVCVAALGVGCYGSTARAGESPACRELDSRFEQQARELVKRQLDFLLLSAASHGCEMLVERSVEAGASVGARDREGNTPLHRAAREGNATIVKFLLDRGARIEWRNLQGSTPLFLAAESNRAQAARLLIERGANVNALGRTGVSVLAAAAYHGNNRLVQLLLEKGADPRAEDATGKSPAVYAAARGFTGMVRALLDRGIDVNARYGGDLTLLMWAAGHANDVPVSEGLATVELVLSRGARLNDVDDRGRTALMIAAELGRAEIVRLLLRNGARRDLKDKDGKTALDLAANEETSASLQKP